MLEIIELTTVGTHSEVTKEPISACAANQSSLVKRVCERSLPRVVIGIVFHLTQISIGIFRSASTHDGTSERKGIRHQTRDVLHRRIIAARVASVRTEHRQDFRTDTCAFYSPLRSRPTFYVAHVL